ncbi:MAG TPA: metalloregulator ArsR/SmtB family transcription factor [Leptolyngbyaceae cyanobacterium]
MSNKDTARYADIFAALGSQPRLEIMRLLFAAYPEGMTVSEIQAKLSIANSTLSHHLEKLRIEGLVDSRKEKQFFWYSANPKTVEELLFFLYNGCAIANPVTQSIKSKMTEEKYMFQNFFEWVMEKLFPASSDSDRGVPANFFQRWTQKAMTAIRLAERESRRLGHHYIGTEQILLGLLGEGSGIAWQFLNSAGVNFENTQKEVEKIIGRGRGLTPAQIPFTPKGKHVLELALEEAQQLGHNYIATEHLLLGIIREKEGLAVRVLQTLGVDLSNLEQRLRTALS